FGDAGGPGADVAVALDDDADVLRAGVFEEGLFAHADGDAAAGGLVAAVGAAEFDGLASDDAGGVAVLLAVGVHHPGHGLGVGAHVGCGDIAVDAEDHADVLGVAAGEA